MPDKIDDYWPILKKRIIEQYKNKYNIESFIQAFVPEFNELEQVAFDLLEKRGLFTAEGAQLDIIGLILNTSRDGRTDEAYRAAIINAIATYNSDGTTFDLYTIFTFVAHFEVIWLREVFPDSFHFIVYDGSFDVTIEELTAIINKAKAATKEFTGIINVPVPDGAWGYTVSKINGIPVAGFS